jgi:hypothetical protein
VSEDDAAFKEFGKTRFASTRSTGMLLRSVSPSSKPGADKVSDKLDVEELVEDGVMTRSEAEKFVSRRRDNDLERVRANLEAGNTEEGSSSPAPDNAPAAALTRTTTQTPADKLRSDALRAVEGHADELDTPGQKRLERIIKSDPVGHDAAYLRAISDPDYERAWVKVTFDPENGRNLLTQEEARAFSETNRIAKLRSLSAFGNAGADGGVAVPFVLDNTVLNVVTGASIP